MTGSVLLQAGRAEAEALGKALSSVRAEPSGLEQMASRMKLLMAHCLAYPEQMRRLWEDFEKSEPCAFADEVIEAIDQHLGLIDQQLQVVNAVKELATETVSLAGGPFDAAAFARAADELLALRVRIADLRDWFQRPLPPWPGPQETREERRAAFERGEYEHVEDILDRLRKGGPLSKG